jgi:hypothetical protein
VRTIRVQTADGPPHSCWVFNTIAPELFLR